MGGLGTEPAAGTRTQVTHSWTPRGSSILESSGWLWSPDELIPITADTQIRTRFSFPESLATFSRSIMMVADCHPSCSTSVPSIHMRDGWS